MSIPDSPEERIWPSLVYNRSQSRCPSYVTIMARSRCTTWPRIYFNPDSARISCHLTFENLSYISMENPSYDSNCLFILQNIGETEIFTYINFECSRTQMFYTSDVIFYEETIMNWIVSSVTLLFTVVTNDIHWHVYMTFLYMYVKE